MATFGISANGSLIPPIERLADNPRKVAGKLGRREGLTEGILGCAFLAAASVLAAVLPWERSLDAAAAALLVLLFAAASRVHLGDGTGHTDPTQIVLVPMLYFLPCPVVPLAVACGLLVGNLPELLTGRMHPSRAVLSLGNSWYAIAPALVFTLGSAGDPDLSDWPLLVAALGAQFTLDFVITALREWAGLGVSPRFQPHLLAWVYIADACLAPLGLLASLIIVEEPLALLLLAPLPVLLILYARKRDETSETADLLGDVLEADDAYTAKHNRSVAELAVQIADKMALDADERRRVEFAALLHDVGKIAVPDEIVNKSEALTDEEWDVMQTHTLRGQEFLAKVGGVFGEVGHIVRASHERWDGLGYPDRLSGPSIPLAARIVSCCDAFNAMTAERPYRLAMSQEVALRELVDNAGTQFDPHVVRTLIAVVRRSVYTPLPELRSPNGDGRLDSVGARSS